MATPVLVCVQFAQDGVTCSQTQWIDYQPSIFPPLTVEQGATVGGSIFMGLVLLWASRLPRRG